MSPSIRGWSTGAFLATWRRSFSSAWPSGPPIATRPPRPWRKTWPDSSTTSRSRPGGSVRSDGSGGSRTATRESPRSPRSPPRPCWPSPHMHTSAFYMKRTWRSVQAGPRTSRCWTRRRRRTRPAPRPAGLSANASNLLMSELPNRRAKGLDLLRKVADPEKAVELDQDPALTPAQLRDQAVEFLVLRDVESQPEFPTGPTRGIEFGPGGTVLAALSSDGDEVTLWNVEHRQKRIVTRADEHRSPTPAAASREQEPAATVRTPASRRNPGPTVLHRPHATRLGPATPWPWPVILAVIRPGDDGLRLYDVRTGSLLHDLDRPGRMSQA